jgi:hypothetical protein
MNFTHRIKSVILAGGLIILMVSACTTHALPTAPATEATTRAVEPTHTVSVTFSPGENAINALRPILGLPDLPLTFVETTHMANSPDGRLQVEHYDDSEGRKFYVDPQTNLVVEIDARNKFSPRPTPGPVLTSGELLEKAMRIAQAVIPNYEATLSVLTYEDSNKGPNYFYDWRDYNQPVVMMPPFVQIGLYESGELFGYINTLSVK